MGVAFAGFTNINGRETGMPIQTLSTGFILSCVYLIFKDERFVGNGTAVPRPGLATGEVMKGGSGRRPMCTATSDAGAAITDTYSVA